MLFLSEHGYQVIIGASDISKSHINAGNHNILGLGITEIEHVVYHLAFLALNNAFLMADVDDGAQLVFCDSVAFSALVDPQKGENAV